MHEWTAPRTAGERRWLIRCGLDGTRQKSMRAEYDFSKGERGAVIPQKGKTRISIFIDNSVLDAFRERTDRAGTGFQTMMNEALRQYLAETDQPVTEKTLRQVLRQEMPEYLRGLTAAPTRTRAKSGTRR